MSDSLQPHELQHARPPCPSPTPRVHSNVHRVTLCVIHTVKGFGIVNEAEIDVFLELSCFFNDPVDVGYLISGASAFSKAILNIWTLLGHVLLKLGLENLSISLLVCECNCAIV